MVLLIKVYKKDNLILLSEGGQRLKREMISVMCCTLVRIDEGGWRVTFLDPYIC